MVIEDDDGAPLSQALQDVIAERARQITEERWTPQHDDRHYVGTLAAAAACYSVSAHVQLSRQMPEVTAEVVEDFWPWARRWWKPKDPRRDMVRAAALLVAEIERIDRAAK
jgi:hypothetical protein